MRGRLTLIMGLLGVAFIFLTFGYIAWEQRNRLIQRNESDIRSTAFVLADHASRILEVADVTLKQAAALVADNDWDQIERSKSLWNHLRAIKETLPYIDNVWLNDAIGRLRLTSVQFPTPASTAADRDAFLAQAERDRGLFIGEPILGRVTKEPTFMISRRLQGSGKSFIGIVSVTVAPSYFNKYWGTLRLPKGSRVTLLRASDARVIAQYPSPPDNVSFVPVDRNAFDAALRSFSRSGNYVSIGAEGEHFVAYHQVGGLPLYISVSTPGDAYWKPWVVQTRLYGAFALIALLALLALTVLASQQFREQAINAATLERQVASRTSELQAETAALEVLNRTGSALAGNLDTDRIVENVVDAGIKLTGAQIGAFFYNDDHAGAGEGASGKQYHAYYASGEMRETFLELPLMSLVPSIFTDGGTIRSDDILRDQQEVSDEAGKITLPDQLPIRSCLAVPVMSRNGEVHGALLFGHREPGRFTERAERLVKGLAAQAAIALENGRLYQDAQREIEERKQAQSQQSLLIRELHHRVKNTLATVQAVVGATARSTSNIDEFYQAFVGRIISLANTHSLLTEAVWQTASLREILQKELTPYNDATGERIVLEGPAVELPSEAAVPIGMAIHELTTNAAKYGALSVSTGRVIVSWGLQPDDEGLRLRLSWEEQGGPKVSPPKRQGFGSRLLHRVLTTQLDAKVETQFEPSGLRVSIDAVLRQAAFMDAAV